MFSLAKIASALLALTSIVSGTITIQTTGLKGNATNTVVWSSSNLDADPTSFTIELANPTFRNNLALLNNVGTGQGSATFTLPRLIPGPDYRIVFVNPGNITDIIAQSNTFTIDENDVGTGASDPASTTITTGLTPGGSTLTSVLPSSKTSTSGTPLPTSFTSVTTPPSSASSPVTPAVSTTGAPAASSAVSPNAAGMVHVPVTLLVLGLAAAGLM
ncbi:hypothetical protein BU17DRAFT_80401 [Hysterangium stoloniferum]|nr:hypothetical protein BU17DRAFT_80401 [Hysterangium stoloniferum]